MSQDQITVDLQPRTVTGKQVRALRRDGVVPAVIHNHGKESIHVQGEYQALAKVFSEAGKNHPVNITADGKKYMAMIKDADFEPKKHQLRHVVFNAVKANQKVDAEVPLQPKYDEGNESSPAERNGLLVISNIDVVVVKALPSKLPEALYYDAEKLVEAGDSATIADLIVPADVELEVEDENQTIATVYEPSALAAANDAAGGDVDPDDEDAEKNVDSEHESNADPEAGSDEIRPGGKKEFEDKEQGQNPEKQ